MKRRALLKTGLASVCFATVGHLTVRQSALAAPYMPRSVFDPFEIAPGLTILYYQVVTFSSGSWELFGEFRNDTKTVRDTPFLSAVFEDDAGNTYYSDNCSPLQPIFEPGETAIFSMRISNDSFAALEGATKFSLAVCSWPETTLVDEYSGFTFDLDTKNVVPDSRRISGYVQITNTGAIPAPEPHVYIVFTDRAGRVANVEPLLVDGPIAPERFTRVEVSTYLNPNAADGYRFIAFVGPIVRVYAC